MAGNSNENDIRLLIGGDFAPVGFIEKNRLQQKNPIFTKELVELFRSHDYTILNLECPLTLSNDKIQKTGPHLKAHPETINDLLDLNLRCVTLANNHIRDYDSQGVLDTIEICHTHNIDTVGAGKNRKDAGKILYKTIKSKKIAIMNFSESEFNIGTDERAGANEDDPINIYYSFQEASKNSDYQVVILHGGKEMYEYPTPMQYELFHFIADLGATAVIGHHTHVFSGHYTYKSTPLIYSLGNFAFDDANLSSWWNTGFLVQITISQQGKVNYSMIPIIQSSESSQIRLANENEKNEILKNVDAISSNIKTEGYIVAKWEELVDNQKSAWIKILHNYNIIERGLLKFSFLRKLMYDRRFLKQWLNVLNCRTTRIVNVKVIESILKK